MRSDNLQVPYTSKSENLQLPCVQPPTSSYNFHLPQGRHGHHGRHGHGGHGGHGGHDGHCGYGGHDGHGCHGGHCGRCDGDRLETIYWRQVAKSDPAAVRH